MVKSNYRLKQVPKLVYLDYASSALSSSPNPGAVHELGLKEKNKLEQARERVAKILDVQSSEIIFTSGSTESNNLAILGIVKNFTESFLIDNTRFAMPHIVTTNIEHASVLEVCKYLERTKQARVTYVGVEQNGIVDSKKIKKAINKNTILVSVMYANNEIGTIQPIREIAKEIRHFNKLTNKKIFFHTDATQAVSYLSVKIPSLGVDLFSFNGAKVYGPKGVGVLYVKKNIPVKKIMFGGDQEEGLRPGTLNVALAVAFSLALENSENGKEKEVARLTRLRDYFLEKLSGLRDKNPDFNFFVNGDLKNRLPNNLNITFPGIPSDLLVIELSENRIMTSAKSACKAGDGKASHVLFALNKSIGETDGSLRFSLGRETTKADIDYTVKTLNNILNKLKRWYN